MEGISFFNYLTSILSLGSPRIESNVFLYVLQTNKDWKACIDDANKRGFLHDVYSSRDLSRALQNETAANLEMVFKYPCQGDKKPTESTLGKDGVEDGFRKSGDKLPENARSEKDGQRTTVVDPRKIQGNNGQKSHSKIQKEPSAHGQDTNNCRGTLSGEGTGEKCIKGDHVTCASTVSGRPGDNDSQRFTYGDKDAKVGGSRERKRANGDNLDLSKRNLNTSKSRDVSSQGNGNTRESTGTDAGRDLKGTDLQGNRNRNNTHCEQNDAVQEASLGARKRKDGLDMVMELDRGSGSLTKCRGYEQRHGETQEDERVEKKRRIEKGVSRDSEQVPGNSERTSLKSDRKDPSRRQGDACDSERRDREESKGNSGPGRMSESDLGDLTFEGRYRGSDNSMSSKRKMEDKHEERKRRKNGETGTRSSSLALQECVTKACKDEPNNYLTISNSRSVGTVNSNNESWLGGTQRSVSRSGLNETLMNADSLPGMAPVLSQTSDDFDFDEYVPTFDDHVSNHESSNGEPKQAAWKNSRPAVKPPQNIVCDQLVDRVVQSGGTLLARNDPYLNQLACHEQRERHARSVSVPSVSATSTPLDFLDVSASVKEIPRTVIHSLPDLVSAETKARTTSTHSKPTNTVRFSLPLQTHRAHPGESSTASALDNVIQRVKSKNPQRPPPPLLNQSDNLASFRRYHGGARERVAHGTRRNQQSNTENTRNIIQARISEFAGNSRERRVPNNMDKIRKSLKKK